MLEMERRTGCVRIQASGTPTIILELVEGTIVHAQSGGSGREPLETMRDVVAWKKGNYSFESKLIELAGRTQRRIGMLLLEAIRLNDEQHQP